MTHSAFPEGQQYTLVNHKMLRNGYTTGTCAAAAAKAGVKMLFTGIPVEEIPLQTPGGIMLRLLVESIHFECSKDVSYPAGMLQSVRCAVRKDGGDDVDATDGILIFAEVCRSASSGIEILGGEGVGTVTRPGLDQPVGSPAINSGPRQMIVQGIEEICAEYGYTGGIRVTISVPEGVKTAERTFNSRLGITGGISILGTTGIVFPMSQKALLDSIELELKMLRARGLDWIIMSPGNYGASFLREQTSLNPDYAMKCSNFIGETLDMAEAQGIKGILFVAHIGKFIKLSGGIMNTHSRESDARTELLGAAALRAGAKKESVLHILNSLTTDEALLILREEDPDVYENTIAEILRRIQYHLDRRTAGKLKTGVILFAGRQTLLGETDTVKDLRDLLNHQMNLENV